MCGSCAIPLMQRCDRSNRRAMSPRFLLEIAPDKSKRLPPILASHGLLKPRSRRIRVAIASQDKSILVHTDVASAPVSGRNA